jgi:hypothetical protein
MGRRAKLAVGRWKQLIDNSQNQFSKNIAKSHNEIFINDYRPYAASHSWL